MSGRKNIYAELSSHEAAIQAVAAELKVESMGFPAELRAEVISGLQQAITARQRSGFYIRPTNPEEVGGVVSAAMGDNAHVKDAHKVFCEWTVGVLQANDADLRTVRERIGGQASTQLTGGRRH